MVLAVRAGEAAVLAGPNQNPKCFQYLAAKNGTACFIADPVKLVAMAALKNSDQSKPSASAT